MRIVVGFAPFSFRCSTYCRNFSKCRNYTCCTCYAFPCIRRKGTVNHYSDRNNNRLGLRSFLHMERFGLSFCPLQHEKQKYQLIQIVGLSRQTRQPLLHCYGIFNSWERRWASFSAAMKPDCWCRRQRLQVRSMMMSFSLRVLPVVV